MASLLPLRSYRRATGALLLLGLALLPGACGGAIDIVFVGSDDEGTGGNGEGGLDGQGGQGGAPGTGGTGTGGGSGGTDTGGTGGTVSVTCGDGETDDGEDCDSGGEDSQDCDFNCTEAFCGDRYTNEEAGEVCDDGTDGSSPGCDTDCTLPACGDGLVHAPTGEQCDDGNDSDGDGCTEQCVQELLVLGDGVSEGDAVQLLREAGFAVTLAPVVEHEFDGTNPVLDEFCGVIQFNATYAAAMQAAGQTALVDYVEEGGTFMSTGWTAVEAALYADLSAMSDLVLIDFVNSTFGGSYAVTPEGATHPITSSLPATFVNNGSSEGGTCKAGSTALLTDTTNATLCIDDEVGEGRAISLGSAFGHEGARPLTGIEMGTLLVNAANWLCGTSHPVPYLPMTVGSTEIVSRLGYKAQCQMWSGNTCLQPWIAMNEADVTAPVPHCIDDTTSLRPMWNSTDLPAQANTWCWIATTDQTYVSAVETVTPDYLGGWMYYDDPTPPDYYYYTGPLCTDPDGRHYSAVDVPTIGNQVWSFDDTSWVRAGYFPSIECVWP